MKESLAGTHQNDQVENSTNGHSASNGYHYPDAPQAPVTSGTLDDKHAATLSQDSAISADAIQERGYWTETDRANLKLSLIHI